MRMSRFFFSSAVSLGLAGWGSKGVKGSKAALQIADAQALPVQFGVPVEGCVAGGEVLAVGSVDAAHHDGAVLDGVADGAELVHRPTGGPWRRFGGRSRRWGAQAGVAAARVEGDEIEPSVSEPIAKATQPASDCASRACRGTAGALIRVPWIAGTAAEPLARPWPMRPA